MFIMILFTFSPVLQNRFIFYGFNLYMKTCGTIFKVSIIKQSSLASVSLIHNTCAIFLDTHIFISYFFLFNKVPPTIFKFQSNIQCILIFWKYYYLQLLHPYSIYIYMFSYFPKSVSLNTSTVNCLSCLWLIINFNTHIQQATISHYMCTRSSIY